MMGQGLLEDGLILWLDGKNNIQGGGYDNNANYWYAYKTAPSLDGFRMEKYGTVNTLINGFQIPYNANYAVGGIISNVNPLTALTDDKMTIIEVASNLNTTNTHESNTLLYFSTTYNNTAYNYRQLVMRIRSNNKLYYKGKDATWVDTGYLFTPDNVNSLVMVYKSDGIKCNINLEYDGNTINYTSQQYMLNKDTNTSVKMILGAYCVTPFVNEYNRPNSSLARSRNNWKDWPGTYNALLIYNRCLSDAEISQVKSFLRNRYGLQ